MAVHMDTGRTAWLRLRGASTRWSPKGFQEPLRVTRRWTTGCEKQGLLRRKAQPAQSVWPALMMAPLLAVGTSISIQPAGRAPKLRFTSTHQLEFWGKPMGA